MSPENLDFSEVFKEELDVLQGTEANVEVVSTAQPWVVHYHLL